MPVIVVGADTDLGGRVVDGLLREAAEVRAFVTDAEAGAALKRRGVKVAVGDVSDESHIGGASARTFCAVLLSEAASDGRERAFAANPSRVVEAWAGGLRAAGTTRAVWVGDGTIEPGAVKDAVHEFAFVDVTGRVPDDVVAEVLAAESAGSHPAKP